MARYRVTQDCFLGPKPGEEQIYRVSDDDTAPLVITLPDEVGDEYVPLVDEHGGIVRPGCLVKLDDSGRDVPFKRGRMQQREHQFPTYELVRDTVPPKQSARVAA